MGIRILTTILLLIIPYARSSATVAAFASATSLSGDAAVRLGAVVKSPRNPVLVQDQPWERRIDNGYPNVVDDGDGSLQLWYGLCLGAASNASVGCSPQAVAYARSSDGGLSWTKPDLGLFNLSAAASLPAFLRALGTHNNLLLFGGGVGVARDPTVATGSAGAYKALGQGACFVPGGGAAAGGVGAGCVDGSGLSADGLTWGGAQVISWPSPHRWDCHNNAFLDARSAEGARWLLTTRDYDKNGSAGLGRQISVVAGAGSSFGGWPAATPVVASGTTADEQLYSMITFRWLDVLLGIVMVFDAAEPTTQGRVHCRLMYQAPGAGNASAPFDYVGGSTLAGVDFIPLGEAPGAFDSHICFAAAHPLPAAAGSAAATTLFYMGGDGPHNGPRNSALGAATLRADGFAAVAAAVSGGAVIANVTVTAARLTATLDILAQSGGHLRIGARGVPGLGIADCTPLVANGTDAPVSFAGGQDFASLLGQTLDFDVELVGAALYALGFE